MTKGRWIVVGWIVAMTSGALAASFFRVPTGIVSNPSLLFLAHGVIAGAVSVALIRPIVRAGSVVHRVALAFVTATILSGVQAVRSFGPLTSVSHAALAAYAALALALAGGALGSVAPATVRREHSWQAAAVSTGVGLLILQIALGALLRSHVIGYGWHVLVAGLAALSILVPAVALSQESGAPPQLTRAVRQAMTSLLVQLALGAIILVMILTGRANVYMWLLATVAHVVAGTVTLLGAARLAAVLRREHDHGAVRDCSADGAGGS
jgi:hypothetical protein